MFIQHLQEIWADNDHPFLQNPHGKDLGFEEINKLRINGLEDIQMGDVVALIGDYDAESIATLLRLLAKGAIIVPLSNETREEHEYFIKESFAQYIFEKNSLVRVVSCAQKIHPLLSLLRNKNHPGLILFTTGTTGRPKAILHDFIPFIKRYKTPRPPLKAVSFLLFDHIGGINTLLHMLFNLGQIVSIRDRRVEFVANTIRDYSVELLPTTPTFLRMLSLSPDIEERLGRSLKIISYGTERMDAPTLQRLCKQFPNVDFRQTYGMSELGILRIKSKARNSLYMNIGGEGVETKIIDNILHIKAENKMLGYLNSDSPFDPSGWYCTKDIVEQSSDGYLKIIGRDSDVINIGGLKFMPSEIERVCLENTRIKHAKVLGKPNPITGQHVELYLEVDKSIDSEKIQKEIKQALADSFPKYMMPSKIVVQSLNISHRFKKL